jgi:hypothetical protein
MPAIKRIELVCQHCGRLFTSGGVFFETTEDLEQARTGRNLEECPHCFKMTPDDKGNMHITLADGSVYQRTA